MSSIPCYKVYRVFVTRMRNCIRLKKTGLLYVEGGRKDTSSLLDIDCLWLIRKLFMEQTLSIQAIKMPKELRS